jgi:hypothetical protein
MGGVLSLLRGTLDTQHQCEPNLRFTALVRISMYGAGCMEGIRMVRRRYGGAIFTRPRWGAGRKPCPREIWFLVPPQPLRLWQPVSVLMEIHVHHRYYCR